MGNLANTQNLLKNPNASFLLKTKGLVSESVKYPLMKEITPTNPLESFQTIDAAINDNKTIPFSLFTMFRQRGNARKAVVIWLIFCALVIPSSVITRLFEWTGIELTVGSVQFYVTVYIPMLFCVPMVFWYDYLWAAIPAYFSTFLVGYIGGMPLEWLLVFSLANPLSLALYVLSYKVIQLRPGMNDLVSIVSFVTISLVASLAGSVGAFIWAYANKVGLNPAYLVWQGWWVGGWLQAVLIVLPILHMTGPYVERCIASIKPTDKNPKFGDYKAITIATISFVAVLVGYVSVARFISIKQFDIIQISLVDDGTLLKIQNAIDGMSYPLYILLTVIIALIFLTYKTVIFWHQTLIKANQQLLDKNRELEELAATDSLTKLFNRRRTLEFATAEFERSLRNQQHLSILMVDIDKFKRINDESGHLVGDIVIRDVAKRLTESVRPYDVAGHYGGEEFIVILPATDLDNAIQIAKRILSKIVQTPIHSEKGNVAVTVSIGASSLMESDIDLNVTIERADQALLAAKNAGRNCLKW